MARAQFAVGLAIAALVHVQRGELAADRERGGVARAIDLQGDRQGAAQFVFGTVQVAQRPMQPAQVAADVDQQRVAVAGLAPQPRTRGLEVDQCGAGLADVRMQAGQVHQVLDLAHAVGAVLPPHRQ